MLLSPAIEDSYVERYCLIAELITLLVLVGCTSGYDANSYAARLSTPALVQALTLSVVDIVAEVEHMGRLPNQTAQGVGTGVMVDDQGRILTNNHEVGGAQRITVTISVSRVVPSKVVELDPTTDLAVPRIDAHDLHLAALADPSLLLIGSDVVAIGHALDLESDPLVSKGVVSALERVLQPDAQNTITGLIQTDAAINPGNSGGSLLNMHSEIIGINTAILESGQRIGFAINAHDAKEIMDELIEFGFMERAFLGIVPVNITGAIEENLGFPVEQGIAIGSIAPGFPAASARLQQADIIVALDDNPIVNTANPSRFLAHYPPGEKITVTFYMGQEVLHAVIDFGNRADG